MTKPHIDKALALVWAARRKVQGHTGWVTSPIDYATEATQVISDLKNYCFRTVNGKAYQVSDTFQGNANPVEIDPSYLSVAAYTIFQNFTMTQQQGISSPLQTTVISSMDTTHSEYRTGCTGT